MDWPTYFMKMAWLAASKSKDQSSKVGCVITSEDHAVLATGFNGLPRGVHDHPERMERPAKYLWTAHAEMNAVAHAARHGMRLLGSTAYVTHQPCSRCAHALLQAGVRRLIMGPGQWKGATTEEAAVVEMMLWEGGMDVDRCGVTA